MAASQLGSFSYDMLLKIAKFEDGLTRAQNLAQKNALAIQKSIGGAVDSLTSGLENLGALLLGGLSVDKLVELGKAALDSAEKVENMAASIGVSTQSIQTLQYTAGLTGASVDSMTGAMARLEKSAEEAASGNKQSAAAFNAIGISASQAAQLMKDPDQLFQVVTAHMAQFADGSGKVTAAQILMGRGAAQNIPLIDKLGDSFGELEQHAKDIGVVLSTEDTQALASAQEGFNDLGQEVKGLANRFTIDLLPTITKVSEGFSGWLESDTVKNGLGLVAANIENLLTVIGDLPSEIEKTNQAFKDSQDSVHGTNIELKDLLAILPKLQLGGPLLGVTITPGSPLDRFLNFVNTPTAGSALANKAAQAAAQAIPTTIPDAAYSALEDTLGGIVSDFSQAVLGADQFGLHVASSGAVARKPLVDISDALKTTKDSVDESGAALLKFQQQVEQLNARVGDPYQKALQDYAAGIDKLAEEAAAAAIKGADVDQVIANWQQGEAQLTAAVIQQTSAQAALDPVIDAANQKIAQQAQLAGLSAEQQKIQTTYIGLLTDADKALLAVMGPLSQADQDRLDSLHRIATQIVDTDEATKNSEAVAKEWAGIWQTAGDNLADTFSKILVEGGSLFDGLKSLAQQTVEAIISYFERLAVINPILNLVFGTSAGFSLLPTLANAGASAAVGAGASGAAAGTAGTVANFGTATGGISLFNAGKTLWDGFINGSGQTLPFAQYLGSSIYGPGMDTAFSPSLLGSGLAIGGGVLAGYNEFQNAGGGVPGLAGGAAYGFGTTALVGGLAGVATGAGFSAGIAGTLGALGPVGWAGLALMAVDMLSGGKLFGTAGKFNFGQTALTVGPSGAVATAGYDLKGQAPLFGGSTHSWQTVAASQEAIDAANQFYAALLSGTDAFAKEFGVKAGDIVGGQFVQNFDKHGNVTSTSDTVLGKTYSDTAQQFQERLDAENMLAVLGTFDKGLNDAVDQFRGNADELLAVTQALAQGETMFKSGEQFLALGTDQSLSALLKLAEGSEQFGETVEQALQRIEQAQAAYDQFVGQFKPATNYVDDFEAALSGINQQMIANIKQANALAVAAGAEGASETDLANIRKYAVQQEQQALMALEQSAQSLAFSMGLSTVGTLDQVNSEIQQLQSQAGEGTSGIQGFGNAIQQVSQKATEAMNLLLGDLSPMNDQQKLQDALQGLRAGTATQEEVLEIGRRLYASSQAYTDLFNMVKGMGGPGASTAGGSTSPHGLSGADQQRLSELLKEQQQLQAAQDYTNAQTLAQQLAEIAAAKSETYQQAASDMHLDLAGLEKRLGLNDDGFAKLIAADQAAKDDNGKNTQDIIQELKDGFDRVVNALTGGGSGAPTGHGSHDFSAQDIVDAISVGFRNVGAQQPRNLRTQRA